MSLEKLKIEDGGRPITNTDLQTLQNLSLTLSSAILQGLATCVLSGCSVTAAGAPDRYNVEAGLVWVSNAVYQFDGASNVALPGEFALGPVESVVDRLYQTGGTKTCITRQLAILEETDDVEPCTIEPGGPLMWYERVAALQRPLGLLEHGVFDLTDYDNGLGKGRHRGWALADGTNGTVNMGKMSPVGFDANDTGYAVNNTGGNAEITLNTRQLPPHTHTYTDNTNVEPTQGNVDAGGNKRKVETNVVNKTTGPTGSADPIDIRSPFRVVAYRQWIGLN